jgi:hypothetical protein
MVKTTKLVCLLTVLLITNSCTKDVGRREVDNNAPSQKQAPAECVAVYREFFAYVFKPEPNIVTDEQAQKRWLSKLMIRAFTDHIQSFPHPSETPDYPTNSTFVGVWNYPTTYSIIGSRHYDTRNDDNPDDNRAVIDVLYEWDTQTDGLENQYPGEKSLRSFIFVHEDGAWKLDDIYTFTDEYSRPGSLRSYFQKD